VHRSERGGWSRGGFEKEGGVNMKLKTFYIRVSKIFKVDSMRSKWI